MIRRAGASRPVFHLQKSPSRTVPRLIGRVCGKIRYFFLTFDFRYLLFITEVCEMAQYPRNHAQVAALVDNMTP
ncbi:MAG: hypothetical protein BWY71_00715 [Planctomycetes bacterium ADurb.Bin412]|nr:MAG: hypothetical protein BWY71_00715 [Planctomycetes bacterium ADurb.Bin412]